MTSLVQRGTKPTTADFFLLRFAIDAIAYTSRHATLFSHKSLNDGRLAVRARGSEWSEPPCGKQHSAQRYILHQNPNDHESGPNRMRSFTPNLRSINRCSISEFVGHRKSLRSKNEKETFLRKNSKKTYVLLIYNKFLVKRYKYVQGLENSKLEKIGARGFCFGAVCMYRVFVFLREEEEVGEQREEDSGGYDGHS